MSKQRSLFAEFGLDADEGQRLKEEGMALAAENRPITLAMAQDVARMIARSRLDRICHSDLVHEYYAAQGLHLDLGPAAGSLFKGEEWAFTGERIKSALITNHSREIKVWRLR